MKYKQALEYARSMRKNPTEAEALFWTKVRGRKIGGKKFNRQFIIEHSEINKNKLYYIVDFHCFEKKLIIELDGKIHQRQKEYDKIRAERLIHLGYRILRFTNEEVLNEWDNVEQQILEVIA